MYGLCQRKKAVMIKVVLALALTLSIIGCKKDDKRENVNCDIDKTLEENESKVTISKGIWGTVSMLQGNCMPIVDPNVCTHCPVKRTVRVYEYTMPSKAVPYNNSTIFFDSFQTQLIAETEADEDGFYQLDIPPGQYTIVTLEQGKIYAGGSDGVGGLSPFSLENNNELKNINLIRSYNAVF
jgi:hypothetical protein